MNLTEANHVILVEPWWNDTVGSQAIARCWRIGQTKTVYVYRLLMTDSIEKRMIEMCKEKTNMSSDLLGKDTNKILDLFKKT